MPTLLTPEIREWIGRAQPPITEEITRRDIRRYAAATDQRLDKYLNGDEAPPMFHAGFFREFRTLDELQPDGHVADALTPPLPLKRIMAGGHQAIYHRPIRPGDTLTATRTLVDIFEKEGRTGPLVFLVTETGIADAQGKPVLTERYTRIMR